MIIFGGTVRFGNGIYIGTHDSGTHVDMPKLIDFLDNTNTINPKDIEYALRSGDSKLKKLLATHPKTRSKAESIEKEKAQQLMQEKQGRLLVDAAMHNNIEEVRRALKDVKISPNEPKVWVDSGLAALKVAIEKPNVEMTQVLIEAKASINNKETCGERSTALDEALLAYCYPRYNDDPDTLARALAVIHVLVENKAGFKYDSARLFFLVLKRCCKDPKTAKDPKVIDCLEHLCKQLEDWGFKEPPASHWHHFVNFLTGPYSLSEVLESARKLLEEMRRKPTHDSLFFSSIFSNCCTKDDSKESLADKKSVANFDKKGPQ